MPKKIRDVVTHTTSAHSKRSEKAPEKQQDTKKTHKKEEQPEPPLPRSFAARRRERSNDAFLRKLQKKRSEVGVSSDDDGGEVDGTHPPQKRRSGGGRWKVALLLVLAVVLGGYAFFPSVTVNFIPREENVVLANTSFLAEKGNGTNGLSFEFIEIRAHEQETVAARGVEQVDQKAAGQITIYNEHSTAEQRFVRNTRFESPDGMIYRINESVVIPGMEETDDGIVPGEVTITVYADIPGEEYNVSDSDVRFTVPGLRGAPSYEGIYARSLEPITGGFSGLQKTAAPEDLERAQERLSSVLREALLSDARSQLPQGFILFEDAILISYEDEIDDTSSPSDNSVTIRRTGILHGIIFHKNDLARAVARSGVLDYGGEAVEVRDWTNVSFAFDGEAPDDITSTDRIDLILNGQARVMWIVDIDGIAQSLAGISKDEFEVVMDRYEDVVERAEATIHPVWKRSFPNDPAKIKVIEEGGV